MEHIKLNQLMDEHGEYIVRMCYLYLSDWHLAEDATQEVFIKAYKSWESFKGESSERTWLCSIAINVCKNYKRTSWFKKVQLAVQLEPEAKVEEVDFLRDLEGSDLLKQVVNLPTKYKEVILLYYYQDLKISEIADALHTTEGTVKMRLNRGRKKIRGALREVELDGTFI